VPANARPLTLAQALDLAARNAPAVIQAEGQVRAGQAAVRAARGAFLPNFALTGSTTQQSPATGAPQPATGELVAGRWATNGGVAASSRVRRLPAAASTCARRGRRRRRPAPGCCRSAATWGCR
jgi:outer membrane protein TolC